MIKNLLNTILLIIFISHFFSCKDEVNLNDDNNKFSFAFITDIHIQNELNAKEGFNKAIDTINHFNPDFVITGGDLVMDVAGQTYEKSDSLFKLYSKTIESFEMPVYNTIGNHDIFGYYKESGVDKNHHEYGKKMYENRIGNRYYKFEYKNWIFFIIDGLEITDNYAGKVDSVQIRWIKKELDSIDIKSPIILVSHMPFITTFLQAIDNPMAANNETLVVQNSKEVLDLFENHNLKLVLQGHTHFYEDIYVNNIRFITSGAICGKWWQGDNFGTEEGFVLLNVSDSTFTTKYIELEWSVALK